ncbi:response regulator [Undibacterium arcticum]
MKSIWIVDDDESIRWVLEKGAGTRKPRDQEFFSNARDAIAALQTETPQVLVSDIRMPGSSGLELLQLVKNRYPGLPVIIMTAFFRSGIGSRGVPGWCI